MSNIRTVTLELMRHGNGFSQALVPSTDYLALCADHPPETVSVPAELQLVLAAGHRGLRYQDSEETRELQLVQMGSVVSSLLGRIPGLLAELAAGLAAGDDMLHLRLVTTGAELALLPFELADAPRGAPGAGRSLVLQGDLPVCITRQVRRVGQRPFSWPAEPRILLVAASPTEAGDVPLQEHFAALSEILEPWLPFSADAGAHRRHLQERLTVLPRADLRRIEQTCRDHRFTHVHILAHGAAYRYGLGERYGIALHDPDDPSRMEIVDGERLALALGAGDGKSGPDVVSLASCDSANPGTLDGGSSVAHSLHQIGVPLVVASQFPLSKDGSVRLTRQLYDRLLWGSDPRRALHKLRRELRLRFPRCHDWAGLVVYTSLPTDIEQQVDRYRAQRADAATHNALDWVDRLLRRLADEPEAPELEAQVDVALGHLRRAKERLQKRRRTPGALGLWAGAEKREAQILALTAGFLVAQGRTADAEQYHARSARCLVQARDLYRQVFRQDLRQNWAVAQYLSLCLLTGQANPRHADYWHMAATAARLDLQDRQGGRFQAWAHATLAELYALAPCLDGVGPATDWQSRAVEQAERLAELADEHPIDVYSTRQQFRRYLSWYRDLCPESCFAATATVADAVYRRLPEITLPDRLASTPAPTVDPKAGDPTSPDSRGPSSSEPGSDAKRMSNRSQPASSVHPRRGNTKS